MTRKLLIRSALWLSLLCPVTVSAQTLLYTLKEGEKIIMDDEHRLLSWNKTFYHLLFTERANGKYAIFNGKEFGPYDDISFWESNSSLLDWAVKKGDSWYQLILDKGLLLGPYDEVIDVYRNSHPTNPALDAKHYGFRARKGKQWFVIIDGKQLGPYPEPDQGRPQFSADGTNWLISYYDTTKHNTRVITAKQAFSTENRIYDASFWNNKLQLNTVATKGSLVFVSDSIKIRDRKSVV